MVSDGNGGWRAQSENVRKRGALESEAAYEHSLVRLFSEKYGHEGVGWTVEHGTRAALEDFQAQMAVTRGVKFKSMLELAHHLNSPAPPREKAKHKNKYKQFSKHQ